MITARQMPTRMFGWSRIAGAVEFIKEFGRSDCAMKTEPLGVVKGLIVTNCGGRRGLRRCRPKAPAGRKNFHHQLRHLLRFGKPLPTNCPTISCQYSGPLYALLPWTYQCIRRVAVFS